MILTRQQQTLNDNGNQGLLGYYRDKLILQRPLKCHNNANLCISKSLLQSVHQEKHGQQAIRNSFPRQRPVTNFAVAAPHPITITNKRLHTRGTQPWIAAKLQAVNSKLNIKQVYDGLEVLCCWQKKSPTDN